jgi:hypothetical protein
MDAVCMGLPGYNTENFNMEYSGQHIWSVDVEK